MDLILNPNAVIIRANAVLWPTPYSWPFIDRGKGATVKIS